MKRSWHWCSNSFTSTSCRSSRLVLTKIKSLEHLKPSSIKCTLRSIVLMLRNLLNWISQLTSVLSLVIVNCSQMLCRQVMVTSGHVRMSLHLFQLSSYWSCTSIWTGQIKNCTRCSSLKIKTQLMKISLQTLKKVTAQLKQELISKVPPPRKSQLITTNQLIKNLL